MTGTADLAADVARIADGDLAALRRVYDATAPRVLGICLRIVADRETAEDALQETYLKLWRRAARFDPARASVMTWLSLIARSTAIDAARSAGRRHAGLDGLAQEPAESTLPHEVDRLALEECLGILGDEQRHAIRSAFFDGYSYAELAQQAAIPLPTLKSRIRRGLHALRSCLDA